MVKKQLCQETQVLTINGTHVPINLEEEKVEQNGQQNISLVPEKYRSVTSTSEYPLSRLREAVSDQNILEPGSYLWKQQDYSSTCCFKTTVFNKASIAR